MKTISSKFIIFFSITVIFLFAVTPLNAETEYEDYPAQQNAEPQKPKTVAITLKDGSKVVGLLHSLQNNIYTIQTTSLGTLDIHEAEIGTISYGQPAAGAAPAKSSETKSPKEIFSNVTEMQQNVLSNPAMMEEINSLTDNQEIVDILQDETFVKDIMTMDPLKIQNNPKYDEIISNPKIQELMKKMQAQMSGALPAGQ